VIDRVPGPSVRAVDSLEVVAGAVEEKRPVVVIAIAGPRTRGAVVDQTGRQTRGGEAVDVGRRRRNVRTDL
jgi:hypothetical protein